MAARNLPAVLGGGRGDQEQRRLQALACDRQERHRHDREPLVAAARDGVVDAALKVALDPVRLPPHPEEHPGQHAHREQRHGGERQQSRAPSRRSTVRWMPTPTASDTAAAPSTPRHIGPARSRRPIRRM
jgi:hypothetical protein